MVNCFLKLLTDSAHWAGAIFQDLVSIVVGLNALILGNNDKPCVSDLRPGVLSQLWVLSWSTSFSFVLFGY